MVSFDDNTGELVPATVLREDSIRGDIESLSRGTSAGVFSTVKADSFDAKISVVKALTNAESIGEHLNKELKVVNVIVQATEMENEATGEMQTVPRVIFLTEDGKAYYGFSGPLFRDAKNLLSICGADTSKWEHPVSIKVVREGKAPRAYFTLQYV